MLSEMFVEWMLNVTVLALKVNGISFHAMCIFFSLKGYSRFTLCFLFYSLALHQHFLGFMLTKKGCDNILRQKSTIYLDVSAYRMVCIPWYYLQALGIDKGKRRREKREREKETRKKKKDWEKKRARVAISGWERHHTTIITPSTSWSRPSRRCLSLS